MRKVVAVEQQVVAFGNDELRLWRHGNGPCDWLFKLAPELRCVNDFVGLLTTQPQQQGCVAGAVKSVGRPLAVGAAKTSKFSIGPVVAIHGNYLRDISESLLKSVGQQGFSGAWRPDQPEQLSLAVPQKLTYTPEVIRRDGWKRAWQHVFLDS